MSSPKNTEREAFAKGQSFGPCGATPEAIYAQEAQGQSEWLESTVLPTDGIEAVKELFDIVGGVVKDPVDGDPIFTEVDLPPGWKKEGSDHSMWTYLLDSDGRTRVSIFYKAAFYDRSAHISLDRRFSCASNYYDPYLEDSDPLTYFITDALGEITQVFSGKSSCELTKEEKWAERDRLKDQANTFLSENYPDHNNVLAYWPDSGPARALQLELSSESDKKPDISATDITLLVVMGLITAVAVNFAGNFVLAQFRSSGNQQQSLQQTQVLRM